MSIGLVVIDVQQVFFEGARTGNLSSIRGNLARLFSLAERRRLPFFLTFEAKDTGDHALPGDLKALCPAHARTFTKTTFAATGLPSFKAAIRESGLGRFVVVGAETDVCVLQTVLGLRAMGLEVLVPRDAVFSSDANDGPAFRRMKLAGVSLTDTAFAERLLSGEDSFPALETRSVNSIVRPGDVAVMILGTIDEVAEPERAARLRDLRLMREWMRLPSVKGRQLFLAGESELLESAVNSFDSNQQLFVIEDAILGPAPSPFPGTVPITYKMLYRELTGSVDPREWPSPEWAVTEKEFLSRTGKPEELPPLKL